MSQRLTAVPAELYEADETAWLDATAALVRGGRLADVDATNLAEYLTDMANRDRREVESRLAVLLAHLLKWRFQPDRRSGGWKATILTQKNEVARHASRGVLRAHAEAALAGCYAEAVGVAAAETGLPVAAFPAACPHTVADLLALDPLADSFDAVG